MYSRYSSLKARGKPEPVRPGSETSAFEHFDARLRAWLPENRDANILDLGCGDGKFLRYLQTRGYENLSGVDISPEQIKLARDSIKNASINETDMMAFLKDKKNIYDCIMALDVIEHLEKSEVLPFLEAVHAALKKNGRVIFQTPNAASPWGPSLMFGDFTHGSSFTPSSLKQLLMLTGFSNILSKETAPIIKRPMRFFFWKIFSACFKFYNLVEMGTSGDGIYTRSFQCMAMKTADQ